MKSYFTKFGAFLLCGVMLAAVGCHDYGEDIQQVNDKVDNLGQDFTTDIAKLQSEIQALKGEAATATALQQAITDFNAGINGLKNNEIKALQDQMAEKASSSNLNDLATTVSGIETKLDELKTQFETAIADLDKTYATDAQVTDAIKEAVNTVNTSIEKINSDITNIKTALDGKADKTDLGIVDQAVKDLTNTVNGISTRLGVAEQGIKDNTAAIGKVASDLTDAQTTLNKAIATAKDEAIQAAQEKVNAAKKDLEDAIATAKNEAIEAAQEKVNAAKKDLEDAIATAKNEAIEAAAADAKKQVKEATDEINKEIARITETLSKLNERLDAVEVNVKNLIRSIQSIVYKPTHADGMARIAYASVAGYTLEGNSTLTYKVYPKAYADSIATAFEDGNEFLSYDVINVTKSSAAKLEIKGISAKDGEIEVTVRANGLDALYAVGSELSHSAALILENEIDHYSTEYTNLTVDTEASKYDLVLYHNNAEITEALSNKVVCNDKVWKKNLFEGVVPMFKSAKGEVLTYEKFAEKYTLPEGAVVTPKIKYNDGDKLFTIVEDGAALNVTLDADKYSHKSAGRKMTADLTYTFGDDNASVHANVILTKFPYTLAVKGTADTELTIAYNEKLETPYTLLADYAVYFKDENGNEVSVEEIEKTYFIKLESLPTPTYTPSKDAALFTVGKEIPVTVTLATDDKGDNLAKAENVGSKLAMSYKCIEHITGQTVLTDEAVVEIVKTRYSFEFAPISTQWTFKNEKDFGADESGAPCCTREYAYAVTSTDITSKDCPADQNISKVFADAGKLVKVTVNGTTYEGTTLADAPVNFVSVDAENVKIQYNGLAWNAQTEENKVYKVEAVYERESATVTVTATLTVKDRNRSQLNFGDIATPDPVVYTANYVNESLANVSFESVFEALTKGGYLGDYTGVTIADILPNTQVVTTNGYEVKCGGATHTFNGALTTGIKFDNAAEKPFTVGFNYINVSKNFSVHGDMPKSYDYKLTLETDYHQIITVESGISFIDPKFDFVKTQNTTISSDNTYYWSRVNPLYYATADPASLIKGDYNNANIYSFAIDNVDMTDAFNVVKPDGTVIEADKFTANNVIATFSIEGSYPNINMVNNILTYGGKDAYVDVTGKIQIANTKDKNDPTSEVVSTYPIENTIFTTDNAYANYRVLGYNPLGKLDVVKKNVTWDLSGKTGVEYFNVLHNFSLSDSRGFALINNASVNANAWVEGDGTNGFADDRSVLDVYSIVPSYEITINNSGSVQGIAIEPNGVIKATVSNLANVEDVVINVKLNVTYPYADDMSNEFTITIPAVK